MSTKTVAVICLRIYDKPAKRNRRGRPMRQASSLRMSATVRSQLADIGAVEDDGTWLTLTDTGKLLAAALRAEKPSRAKRRTGYRLDKSGRHAAARAKVPARKRKAIARLGADAKRGRV